jgi:hypothetical protein
MKVIIAGSRHMPFSDYPLIARAAARFEETIGPITEVVCGLARGADTFGKKWAMLEKGIPVKDFPADWDTHGKKAGPIRNGEMAEYADALIAFLYPNSRGTANMIQQMQNRNKPCYIIFDGEVG